MSERGRIRVESGVKRVRAMFGGTVVAATDRPLLVWEKPYYPTYYFMAGDVATEFLTETGETTRSPSRGEYRIFDLGVGDRSAPGAVSHLPESPISDLNDTYRIDWASMDHWFEEDEEVFVHPRDPYKRVDALRSSRHITVEIDGVVVADSSSPVILFETGLPPRYYLPKTDVRMDLLTETDTSTECPYKGTARYWSVTVDGTVHTDVVWGYDAPLPESFPIGGLVSFYNEKVDISVDGRRQERPKTPFS